MKKIWHTREDFTVVALEDPTKFLFSFKSDFDRKKMMRRSPWTYDPSLLLLKGYGWKGRSYVTPWILKVFGWELVRIPPIFLTSAMCEKIGSFLGTFYMVDRGLNGDCLGSFLRIRVGLKISQPLKRCITLRLSAGGAGKTIRDRMWAVTFFLSFLWQYWSCGFKLWVEEVGGYLYWTIWPVENDYAWGVQYSGRE